MTMQEQELQAVIETLCSFPMATYEEWRSRAEKTLHGKPFDALLTDTYEGITLQPLYSEEMSRFHNNDSSLLNPSIFTLDNKRDPWVIHQENRYPTAKQVNHALQNDLANGQTGIHLVLSEATKAGQDVNDRDYEHNGLHISNVTDMEIAFQNVDLTQYPLFIETGTTSIPFIVVFVAYLKKHVIELSSIHGAIGADPLISFVSKGTIPYTLRTAYDYLAHLAKWTKEHMPKLKTIIIDGTHYHNGGGSAIEELAFSFATAVEYIRNLQERNLSIDEAANTITFSYSIGANLFMEVAKFRAARLIWPKIIQAFGGDHHSQNMSIHASTSKWNKTLYDPHMNIVRGAIEAFTGAISGVDSLHVAPFDDPFRTPTTFTRRIARNTQLILQKEMLLHNVIDPARGSWYVEALTEEIANQAWTLFQRIEAKGGMEQALIDGFPQDIITKLANRRINHLKMQKDILVGTNQFVNVNELFFEKGAGNKKSQHVRQQEEKRPSQNEKMESLDSRCEELIEKALALASEGASLGTIASLLVHTNNQQAAIKRIVTKRGAEPFEDIRFMTERFVTKTGVRPKVLLTNYGSILSFRSRVEFARTFFEVSGLSIVTTAEISTTEKMVEVVSRIKPDAIAIASTDEMYANILPQWLPLLKKMNADLPIYVIGELRSDLLETCKALGLERDIHDNSNLYEVLIHLQKRIGVRT